MSAASLARSREANTSPGLEAAGFEDVSVEFTHEVADGLHGAIVRGRQTLEPERKGLPVLVAAERTPAAADAGPALARVLVAEAIGTFALVFAGCGAIMVNAETQALGNVGVALVFGLVIMAMIYAVGPRLRGALQPGGDDRLHTHTAFPGQPRRRLSGRAARGALAAALLLRASLGDIANVGATQPSGSEAQSFLWELVLTAFLMFVILAVATDTRAVGEAAAIAVGGTIALDALFGGPISGASMNPTRSLAPALVSGEFHALWLYLAAPVIGATIGGLAYQFVRGEHPKPAQGKA